MKKEIIQNLSWAATNPNHEYVEELWKGVFMFKKPFVQVAYGNWRTGYTDAMFFDVGRVIVPLGGSEYECYESFEEYTELNRA